MTSRWAWLMQVFARKLWLRAALYCLGAVAAALAAPLAEPFIPPGMARLLAVDAVDRVLGILASSMLAVTTFSLTAMVSAHAAVASSASPRASALTTDDPIVKNTLGAFIGAFLFGLTGLMTLDVGLYGERGHVVLFLATIAVLVLVVATLLRWIEHLTRLGRMSETTDRVEDAATRALTARAADPCLGARPLRGEAIPAAARALAPPRTGYVQHLDMAALLGCAERTGARIWVLAPPGAFADPARPLLRAIGLDDPGARAEAARAFTIGVERTFDNDPGFGLSVLAEIASRALSPGINDPATAVDVIRRGVRLLSHWADAAAKAEPESAPFGGAEGPQVMFPAMTADDMFDDLFPPIARDGAGMLEVQIALQEAFASLAQMHGGRMRAAATRHASRALARAETALTMPFERARLREAARLGPGGI